MHYTGRLTIATKNAIPTVYKDDSVFLYHTIFEMRFKTSSSSDESEDAVPETQPTDETRTYQNQPQNHHMNTSS